MPAKLAARVRVYSHGHGRKTDKDDAVSVGLAALDGAGVRPVTAEGDLVSMRLLCDRREELTSQRIQAVCRPHRLLAELTPGGMRRELSANKAKALLAQIRPDDEVSQIRECGTVQVLVAGVCEPQGTRAGFPPDGSGPRRNRFLRAPQRHAASV